MAPLLAIARKRFSSLKKAIADGGSQAKMTADEMQEEEGVALAIVKRSEVAKGFHVLPKRWIVACTYGWLPPRRRLVKNYANLTRGHVGFIILATIRVRTDS